jgi:hypothetical protein
MSARHRSRRHGGASEATIATGAAVTGSGSTASERVPSELGQVVLVEGAPADAPAVAEPIGPVGVRPNRSDLDGDGDDGRDAQPGGSPDGRPRRAPRVRDRAPIAVSAASEPTPAPAIAESSEPQKPACTLAQMRRFIKSRPYVPVHELRRRFLIEGNEDDVNAVLTERGVVYVGLPASEARFLSDLIRAGEVGCELLLDPTSPAVVGVYAMRPVARQ